MQFILFTFIQYTALVRKITKVFVIIIGCIIALNILLFLVFSIPAVQKAAADFALKKLKPIVKTEISIETVRIRLFNTIELGGLYVEDQRQDTLLYAGKLSGRINIWNLLDNHLSIEKVGLKDFRANVYRDTKEAPFNFQFLIDAFASDKPKPETTKEPMKISINNIRLTNGTLSYNILSEPQTPGRFNPDHFFVRDFKLIGNIESLDMKNLVADIKTLSFKEMYAGVVVDDLQGMVRSKNTKLWSDRVDLTLNNSDLHVTKAQYDTDSKEFALTAKSRQIDPEDAAIFSESLVHLDKPFTFEADIEGKLPEVSVRNLIAAYGKDTRLEITGLINNYNQFDQSNLQLDIKRLTVSQEDLQALIRIGSPDYVSVSQLKALGDLDLTFKAKGKLSRFDYEGVIRTQRGNVTLSGIGQMDKKFENLSFEGPVKTSNLQLAAILGEGVGVDNATLTTNVKFQMRANAPMLVSADGQIISVVYKGEQYNHLHFDGTYSGDAIVGTVHTNTEHNKFHLFADMNFGKMKKMNIKGTIDKLRLDPFIKREQWKNPYLVMRIDGNLAGKSFDEMSGTILIDSTSLYDDNFVYNPGPIYLQATADEGAEKKIQILSSFLEGEITGDYHFATIGTDITHALQPHLPSLFQSPSSNKQQKETVWTGENNFRFSFRLKNTEDISYAFALPFYNVEPATINGIVNMTTDDRVSINAHFPRLMVGTNDIRESKIDFQTSPNAGIALNANTYLVQDNGYINAVINSTAISDSLRNRIFFDVQNNVAKAKGDMQIWVGLDRDNRDSLLANIEILPSTIAFNNKNIELNHAKITYSPDRISIDNFGIKEQGALLLGIEGIASKSENENVRIYFNNTDLANILAAFNIANVNGMIKGDIIVHQALKNPIVHTKDLRIENIVANNEPVGDFIINGRWDNENLGVELNAYLMQNGMQPLDIKGFIPTGDESPIPMSVNMKIWNMGLKTIQPFAQSTFSELSGNVSADIRVTGKLSEPITEGWLGIDRGIMKVAYTNVTYHISDTIKISRDNIGLNNLVIRDDNNHEATLNVKLSHSNFGRMVYDVNIQMNDFLLLNNEERTDLMAYGTLRLSGNINLTGSPNGIFGDADLRSESRSKVMIELPQTASASEYKGIIYINTPEQSDSLSFLRKKKEREKLNTRVSTNVPINFKANIDLTPQLEAGVIINPTTGDALQISGNGELNLLYNSQADPSVRIYGDYIAQDGKFKYNIQGLKTIDFKIKQGSTVTMIGDPLSTRFNIIAYHQVNADLATLSESFKVDVRNTRMPVNALLEVRGNMELMDLKYNIELPEATQDVQHKFNSLIGTDEIKTRQFGYLLVTGGFAPLEGTSNAGFTSEALDKRAAGLATGYLTKGLDALFAYVLNDNWSVNTNLKDDRVGVDVSTRLLNDRLRIRTNISYGDNFVKPGQQAFMGEFEGEYDINTWLMIRAFNRLNQSFERRAMTTQGVGVVVKKEGRTFKDLFRFRFGQKKEEDKN